MSRYSLILKSVGFVLFFVLQVVLARLMRLRDYGDYTVIMTWINILVAFSLFGFNHSSKNILTSLYDSKKLNKVRGFVRFSFRFTLIVSLLIMVVLFVFLFNNARKYTITYSEAFFWSIFLIPLLVMINQGSAVLAAFNKVKQSLMPGSILLPVSVTVAVIISYLFNGNILRLDTVVFLILICTFFISWLVNAKLKREVKPTYNGAFAEYEYGAWFKSSAILLALNLFPMFLSQIDVLLVSYFSGNTKAGIYAAASRYAMIIPFLVTSMGSFYGSADAEQFRKGEPQTWKGYFTGTTGRMLIYIIVVALVLIAFGKYFLFIYGKEFGVSYLPLVVLTAGQLISTLILNYCSPFLNKPGTRITLILVYFFSTLLSLLLNYFLISLWGLTGAAFGTSISLLAMAIVIYIMAQGKVKSRF